MESVPKALDWVTARAKCSKEQMFQSLRDVVESDVKTIEARSLAERFVLTKPTRDKFVVSRTWDTEGVIIEDSVAFELLQNGIHVKLGHSEIQLFVARPSLTSCGECKLEINGESLELWQVSRKALEDLFFPS